MSRRRTTRATRAVTAAHAITESMATDTDTLSPAEILTSRIRRACTDITTGWPHMLPDGAPAQRYRAGRSRPAGILGAPEKPDAHGFDGRPLWLIDQADSDHDIDPITRIVSLRARITVELNGWCRALVEDRDLHAAIPGGTDVPGMCAFLDRHADWIARHAEYAEEVLDDLAAAARSVNAITNPWRKDRHYLGPCPFVYGDSLHVLTGDAWSCQGHVYLPIGGDETEATCDECEQAGPLRWWEGVLGLAVASHPVTIPKLVPILAERLHLDITDRTLRNWASEGRIRCYEGPRRPGEHRLFEVRDVLDEAARQGGECVMCGQPWEGQGDTCTRCWVLRRDAKPRKADPTPPIITSTVAPAEAPLPMCSIVERDTCQMTGLPTRWCACGTCA